MAWRNILRKKMTGAARIAVPVAGYFLRHANGGGIRMDPRQEKPVYIAIDLKSYYASVECAARGRNPLTFNLLVADESRSDKTIVLAVSPSLRGEAGHTAV